MAAYGAFDPSGPSPGDGAGRSGAPGRIRRDELPRRTTRLRRPQRPGARRFEGSRALPRDGAWTPERDLDAAVLGAMGPGSDDLVLSIGARRVRGGVVDHVLVAPTGVWLVGTLAARGKVVIEGAGTGTPHLDIAGLDRSDAIATLAHQVAVVNASMVQVEAAALVRGALCLVVPRGLAGAPRPLGGVLRLGEVVLLTPPDLATQLHADGLLSAADRTRVARALARRLPTP